MQNLAQQLGSLLLKKNLRLVTAESCTGGLLAATITHEPGVSATFERGYITYSNDSKIDLLGVKAETIEAHGAVSAETAEQMAAGALFNSRADIAVSITGIAGPDGGSKEKPVGLVYFGYAAKNGLQETQKFNFSGNRTEIQTQAATQALKHLIKVAEDA